MERGVVGDSLDEPDEDKEVQKEKASGQPKFEF